LDYFLSLAYSFVFTIKHWPLASIAIARTGCMRLMNKKKKIKNKHKLQEKEAGLEKSIYLKKDGC